MDTMEIVAFKKKKYFILLFVMLVLAAITAGIYIFVNPNKNNSSSYTVNKYSDVVEWCDTSLDEEKLSVNCKALLINIDLKGCFEVQVITKNREFKDLTICESNETLSYTNEILDYKMLMPLNMALTYSKESKLKDYSFNKVSFSKVDDTYIQSIVNEDIANLVSIDKSTTTIQNSVDFCPKPETLPSYIAEDNKIAYTKFYDKNIMNIDKYKLGELYSLDDSTIRLLFTCDSKKAAKYVSECKPINISLTPDILNSIKSNPQVPKAGGDLSEYERYMLKKISLLYDSTEYIDFNDNSSTLNSIITDINLWGNLNEEVYCGAYKLLKEINSQELNSYISKMENTIYSNIRYSSSIFCQSSMNPNIVDKDGLYLKNYYANRSENFIILNKCSNLENMLNK